MGNFQSPQDELGRLFHVQKYRATKCAGDRHDGQNKPAYYNIAAGVLSIGGWRHAKWRAARRAFVAS